MAGGGTGGHVLPLIAVAEVLRKKGHSVLFFGTKKGIESRLAPAKEIPIEYIDIGGLKSVGAARILGTLWDLPFSTLRIFRRMRAIRPGGVFSMGGFVAGPTV